VIDFHCHLDLYPDPIRMAEECRARGMYILSMTTTPSAWPISSRLSREGDRIRTALGLHPQVAHERQAELSLFDKLVGDTSYVGEIGLDGAPEFKNHWGAQVEVFTHILEACRRVGGRIMSIHSRRASKAVLEQLAKHSGAGTPILHWFSGTLRELERAIDLGCWFSVGPAMLSSQRGRELAAHMPRDRILTETDGPFAQIDGKSLMPWDAQRAVGLLSTIWGVSAEDVESSVRDNLRKLVLSPDEFSAVTVHEKAKSGTRVAARSSRDEWPAGPRNC
jgi:TatD DNase family protein